LQTKRQKTGIRKVKVLQQKGKPRLEVAITAAIAGRESFQYARL
jgi:hypothetical protein